MGKGSTLKQMNKKDAVIYYVDFAVRREKDVQKYFGQFHLESAEPFDYKPKQQYTIMVTDLVLADATDFKKVMN